jgi:hypothetical protein
MPDRVAAESVIEITWNTHQADARQPHSADDSQVHSRPQPHHGDL